MSCGPSLIFEITRLARERFLTPLVQGTDGIVAYVQPCPARPLMWNLMSSGCDDVTVLE